MNTEIDAALTKEHGITFLVTPVKRYGLNNSMQREQYREAVSAHFRGCPGRSRGGRRSRRREASWPRRSRALPEERSPRRASVEALAAGRRVAAAMTTMELTAEERQKLWEQFVEVYAESQDSFDTSVRTLAAAGIAVAASLAAALHGFNTWGVASVVLFVVSLTLNLASFLTTQFDMRARLRCIREGEYDGIEGNRWTAVTTGANLSAGTALIAGAALLATFVAISS